MARGGAPRGAGGRVAWPAPLVLQIAENVERLSEALNRLESMVERTVASVRSQEDRLAILERLYRRADGRLGSLEGAITEMRWRSHFAGRFGRFIRRARLVEPRDLTALEDADESGVISPEEAAAVRQLDLLVERVDGRGDETQAALLAVEASTVIEPHDVERALARADTLRRLGYPAIPAVAGARMDASLRDDSVARGVQVFLRPDDIPAIPEIEP